MEHRFTFSFRTPHGEELLAHLRESLEAVGCTCTVEVSTMTRHAFALHTLVVVYPRKHNPVVFTRASDYREE